MAHSNECGAQVRGGGICHLTHGHRGYHSTVTFTCDGCNKIRRGRPTTYGRDGEYPRGMKFCFLCSRDL
jgi:hypothetical protein